MFNEKYLIFAKGAFKLVTSAGVAKIVHTFIDNNVVSESKLDTVKIWAATGAIVGVITTQTSNYIDTQYYETKESLRELKEQFTKDNTTE